MNGGALALTAVLLAVNAFFVALEFAVVAVRPTTLSDAAALGDRRAVAALEATRTLQRQLAGAQLGITIASLGLGWVAEPAFAHVIESAVSGVVELPESVLHTMGFLSGLSLVVFLHMVVGEMVPKSLAISDPTRMALALARTNAVWVRALGPVISALNGAAAGITKLLRVEVPDDAGRARTPTELAALVEVSHAEGELAELEREVLAGLLDFAARPVREIMVPHDRVTFVSRNRSAALVLEEATRTGHSRIPVVRSSFDDVIGYVHVKDVLQLSDTARQAPLPGALVRRLLVVAETQTLDEVLQAMQRHRVHVALVRGPSGAASGLVTLEDVLEALVGDILDETDPDA